MGLHLVRSDPLQEHLATRGCGDEPLMRYSADEQAMCV